MKIISDKIYLSLLPDNKVAVSFIVDNRYLANRIVNEMAQHEQIQVEFKKYSSNRTLAQNDMMWAVISKISDYINGERTQDSLDKIYAEILTQANVKRDLVAVLPNALDTLKSTFRAVVPTGQSIESVNEKTGKKATLITVWVYHGSSKLTTKEMSELLEYAFVYAIKSGVSAMEVDSLKGLYDYE